MPICGRRSAVLAAHWPPGQLRPPSSAAHQQSSASHWLLCDYRPGAEQPPALGAQTHFRRHQDARWRTHVDACDFHHDPADQEVVIASYSRSAAAWSLAQLATYGVTTAGDGNL
jgi:hypothetical protein